MVIRLKIVVIFTFGINVLCYRYVTLGWRSGNERLQRRQPLEYDVEQLLTWHQKCSRIPARPGQSNMTFTVSEFFCGNCLLKRNHLKMVDTFSVRLLHWFWCTAKSVC